MRLTAVQSILLTLGLTLSAAGQAHRLDAIDPTEESEFPGGRGRDQLILYTPEYGQLNTGTNELGSEAVVIDGLVANFGGNDSEIPSDGFILSGNGSALRWMVRNLAPGTPVAHDENSVWIDHSITGQLASARWRLADAERRLAEFPESAEESAEIESLRAAIAQITDPMPAMTQRLASLEAVAFDRELAALPSPAEEVHAVWHRLDTASPEAIAAEVEAMAQAHVNALFTEVNFGSSVVYPDPTGLFPQVERFQGSDPLEILIEECHARGIEVHAWVHNFFLGYIHSEYSVPQRFGDEHPEWVSVNRRGESVLMPWGYMYLNPAHLGLHDALIEAHTAMMEAYDLDGYHYDHIRFCLSLSWESGWDYSDHTRGRVREELGFDPMEISPDENGEEWAQWIDWRQAQVTRYVERQSEAIRRVRPDALISAAVFPDLEAAIENKGQNWGAWVESGHLNAPMPMIYTPSVDEVRGAVQELVSHMPGGSPAVIGLGPYLGFSPRLLVDQIVAAREAGATGECLFVWHRLDPADQSALASGPWRWSGSPSWE
ncbi:family 10 glycosylhydrolase [Candidatus Sumerlaeota bacterium]|nr:family 10 glycosylhydrolase [Candidatus Sumerlaeota bacterium]